MSARRSQVYYNLAHLVAAGVPIVRAAKTAGSGMRGKIARAVVAMAGDMEKGCMIGEAMRKRPRVFPPLDVMIVDVADSAGSLPEGLRMLAQWYELMARIKSTIISGMVFPLVILNIAAFVAPIPNQVMRGFDGAAYLREAIGTLMMFYVPIVFFLGVMNFASRGGPVRMAIDAIALYIPVLGSAIREMALSRYCLAFSMMSKAGVSVVTTAQSAADLTGNAVIGGRLAGGVAAAKAGNQISEGFSKRLPMDFLEMWKVGEETGNTDDVTARMAKRYEESADRKFTELAKWLPKIFYFFVCLMMIKMIFSMAGYVTGVMRDATEF